MQEFNVILPPSYVHTCPQKRSCMKKSLQSGILALCSLMLYGCPYESTVPVSQPSIAVEEQLLGQWVSEAESYNEYFISKADKMHYKVLQRAITGHTADYLGHLSEVKGITFLNLYSDSTQTYYLYRINLNAAEAQFTLMPVSSKLTEHFSNSAALRNFVEKNMNLRSFYDSEGSAEFVKLHANKP